jgi:hypothetical protein
MSRPVVKRSYPPVKAEPVVVPEAPVAAPEVPAELRERRRFSRPIPVAQVIECNEEEAWELWSQWSSL